jgi:hypothetical protein
MRIKVAQDTVDAAGEGTWVAAKGSKMGIQTVMDFYTYMAITGKAYQVYAGNISVPFVGDVVLADTAAEIAIDAPAATTIIPVYCNISFNLAAATLFESAGKSVGAVSTVGDAFVPLPLYMGGAACVSTARADAAGGCTVAAEVTTTTRRHFSWSQPIAAGAWPTTYDWAPKAPPVLPGASCFYVQIAGTTTGPSYFASVDFIELPTTAVS